MLGGERDDKVLLLTAGGSSKSSSKDPMRCTSSFCPVTPWVRKANLPNGEPIWVNSGWKMCRKIRFLLSYLTHSILHQWLSTRDVPDAIESSQKSLTFPFSHIYGLLAYKSRTGKIRGSKGRKSIISFFNWIISTRNITSTSSPTQLSLSFTLFSFYLGFIMFTISLHTNPYFVT